MTPTQFDALNSAIANSIAASRETLAKIDLLLARLTASEPIEPFNAAQDASDVVEASEVPETTIPPCGWPPEPAPEGMRWRYAGDGDVGAWLEGPVVFLWPNGNWSVFSAGTSQNGGSYFHYFTAEPIQP